MGVYVSEAVNLPDREQRRIIAVLRERVTEWTDAVMAQQKDIERQAARIRTGAAVTIIDDVVRLSAFHERPHIACEIRAIAMAALLDETSLVLPAEVQCT